ncbi:MAG: LiaF transmembrane domain-containing protein [Bacillota bacterium]
MNSHKKSQVKWGIILIGLGILFLLNTMGIINNFNWSLLLQFWPVIIILIGLNIVLKNTPLWWLTSVIFVCAVLALFLISPETYDNDFNFIPPYMVNRDKGTYRTDVKIEEGIERLNLYINFTAGRLRLNSVHNNENLYEANIRYINDKPDINYDFNEVNNTASLVIDQPEGSDSWLNIGGDNNWRIYLTPDIPVSININAGAGDFNLNLEDLMIEELSFNSGAGDMEIDLGDYAKYVRLNSAAADVDINIPEGKAVSIKTSGLINNNNFLDQGLIKINDRTYQTTDYNNSDNKIMIEVNSPASNIDLDFYKG